MNNKHYKNRCILAVMLLCMFFSFELLAQNVKFTFKNTPMPQVIKELERWHGINIIVTDNSILKYNITADFNSESIVQIADLIKLSARIDYKYQDKTLYLSGR